MWALVVIVLALLPVLIVVGWNEERRQCRAHRNRRPD